MKDVYFVVSIILLFLSIFLVIEGFDINANDTVKVAGVVSNNSLLTPTGSIVSYLGTGDPDGWVICDGGARADHAKYDSLMTLSIGRRESGKYFPPDLRGRFLRGQDTLRETGGNGSISLSVANMPSHSHGSNTGTMNQNWSHNHGGNTGTTSANHTHGTYDNGAGTVAYVKSGVGFTAAAVDDWGPSEISLEVANGRGGSLYDLNTRGQSADHSHSIPWHDINHSHAIPAEGSGTAFDITPSYYGVRYIVKYA